MQEISKLFDRNSAVETINKLSEVDLRFLNHLIVERIKSINRYKSTNQLSRFCPGDTVRFKTLDGVDKIGTVIRVNQKTLSISTGESDGWWKLSPVLVQKVEEKEGNNIIE